MGAPGDQGDQGAAGPPGFCRTLKCICLLMDYKKIQPCSPESYLLIHLHTE